MQTDTIITNLVPRHVLGDYYTALNAKHFAASAVGSRFTTVTSVEELLNLAVQQRGHLSGTDRAQLVAAGADPAAFGAGIRYLLVRTPGVNGMVRSERLAGEVPVLVSETKPGCPLTLSVAADVAGEATTTEVATVIIGPAPADCGASGEVVYTAHPGLPVPPAAYEAGDADPFSTYRDTEITVDQVRAIHGGDLWLQVRF